MRTASVAASVVIPSWWPGRTTERARDLNSWHPQVLILLLSELESIVSKLSLSPIASVIHWQLESWDAWNRCCEYSFVAHGENNSRSYMHAIELVQVLHCPYIISTNLEV